MSESLRFYLTLICGISIGFSLAVWVIGFRLIDWREIKTMWREVRLEYYRFVLRRLR